MELTKEMLKELAKPFPANRISIKVQTKPNDNGNSLCVAYIDARDVMDRLDDVAGGEWQDSYKSAPSGGLECALTICGVTRCDVGDDKNDNEAEKAGYSDAFKRAAVKFGVGRFLYSLPKMYGKVKPVGKNFFLEKGEEERLQGIVAASLNGKQIKVEKPVEEQADKRVWTLQQKQAIVDAKLADHVNEAKAMLDHSILKDNAGVTVVTSWAKYYRGARDEGKDVVQAAQIANEAYKLAKNGGK